MAARKDFAQNNRGKNSASRTRAKAKAKTGTKPSAPVAPPKKRFPVVLSLLTIVALCGLGYLLYQLAGISPAGPTPSAQVAKPSTPVTPKSTPVTESKPARSTPVVSTSDKPEEKTYDFYKMLEDKEVDAPEVPVYKSTPKTEQMKQSYLLQTGSFRSQADAEKMRAQLLLQGLPNVHTNRTEGKNGVYYRVRTGPFETRSALNKAQDKLVRLNIQPLKVKAP